MKKIASLLLALALALSCAAFADNTDAEAVPVGYEVGMKLPDFTFTDAEGKEVSFYEVLDGPTYINLFATWCYYCTLETPDLVAASKAHTDVQFMMLDVEETPEEAAAFAEQYGVEFPIYHLSDWIMGEYVIEGIPQSFVVDGDGVIRAIIYGYADAEHIESALAEVAATAPAAA